MTAMEPLVSPEWLAGDLGAPDLRVLECTVHLVPREGGGLRVQSARSDWAAGHIPTSQFVELQDDLSDTDARLRFTFPGAEHVCAALGRLGVGDGDRIVLYDRGPGMWAARVWWMLRACGVDSAALLDGGLTAWTATGGAVTTETTPWPAATLTPRPRGGLFVGRDEVLAAIGDDATCVVNALDGAQHRGEVQNYARPGRIPGSANVAAIDLVDPSTNRFRPLDELRSMFDVTGTGRVIAYCGGGVAASADAFTLFRLGRGDVAVYDNSLNEWAADPSLPMEV